MPTVSSPSHSQPRSTIGGPSPYSSPTRPPPPPPSHPTSTLSLPSSINLSRWENLPGCPSASPPTKPSSLSTPSPWPSCTKPRTSSSRASRSRYSTPKTYASSPPGTSTPTLGPGSVKLPPPLLSLSTPGTSQRWAPLYAFSPAQERLSAPTPPIGTRSARTAGASDMSPLGAPPSTLFAPFVPSTTPVPCTDISTLPALEVATPRLLLAVALPYHLVAPTAKAPTLRLTGIVSAPRLRPLSGVPPLPKRLFSHGPLATQWTRPPKKMTSPPLLHPPALSSQRSRWLLQEPEAQRYFQPQ